MEPFQIEYLHILPPNIGRTYRFIKFMNQNFDCGKHKFLVTAIQATVVNNYTRLLEFTDLNYLFSTKKKVREASLKSICRKSRHIIWHTLKSPNIDIEEFLKKNPELLKRSVWVEQGFDISPDGSGKSFKVRRKLKNGDLVRRRIGTIASSFPLNADVIRRSYGKEPVPVTYPPNELLPKLVASPLSTKFNGGKYQRIIQLCTDSRVYSRINPLLLRMTKRKRKDKHLKNSLIILPSNISLRGDESGLKCKKDYLSMAKKAAKRALILSRSYQPERYINYNRMIDALIVDPKCVIYPEYILAPIFCGVKVYYPSNGAVAPYLQKASLTVGKTSCLSYERYRRVQNDDDVRKTFAVFDDTLIKEQWQTLFGSLK